MARLPIYTNNANISVANRVESGSNPIYGAMSESAKRAQELSVQWQKIQNAAESLDGKNKMIADATDILTEAENFTDYKTPADLKRKEDELIGKMDTVLSSVTEGFTNGLNAQQFSREYQLTMAQNTEKLKAIFRNKYIDNNAANLALSYDNNKKAFISSGNEAFRQSYIADLESSFKAGFIDKEAYTRAKLKTDDWDFDFALNQALLNPEETLNNLGNFHLNAEKAERVIQQATSVLNKKKNEMKKGKNQEESLKASIAQTVNNQIFNDMWKNDDSAISKDKFQLFEFRNAIQEKFMENGLSEKDYSALQAKTIAPLLKEVSNHSAGNPVWWNTGFDEAVLGVREKVNLENENDEVKAYTYDLIYSAFKEKGIDPQQRFNKNEKEIENVVASVTRQFLQNKEPNLLGVEANKVLLGTKIFDYKTDKSEKEIQTSKYRLMKDKKGTLYKVYTDKNGNFSNDSIMERVK